MRLLAVADLRPLAEYGREITSTRAGTKRLPRSRTTWKREPLTFGNLDAAVGRAREALEDNPDLIAQYERLGRERSLIYKSLALTGRRKGELSSLTVGQLDLDGPVPYAVLNAADEKNRQGLSIPLRSDLASELEMWLEERRSELQIKARPSREPIPVRLPPSMPLFDGPHWVDAYL